MKILLTGANGYIGKRLLPVLIKEGHKVICCVRDVNRFSPPKSFLPYIDIIEVDFLDANSLNKIPENIDGAYYLIHSMSSAANFDELEYKSAQNFKNRIQKTNVDHVIYLSGIVNEKGLSKHLASRKAVEDVLASGRFNFTTLRAGIIIGSGSGSYEIIRDLAEKLPVMITPKWLKTKCQPIAVNDVVTFLHKSLFNTKTFNDNFDIGGPEVLTYKEMLMTYAQVRGLKRWIVTVPIMTPRLSSYWLYFITSTSFMLAYALVNSMKMEVICRDDRLNKLLNFKPINYKKALERTFLEINDGDIISSWKDALISGVFDKNLSDFIEVPSFGCFVDKRSRPMNSLEVSVDKIWKIGGKVGWYSGDWLWKLRGFIDKLFGGVGLRRGRTNTSKISEGDAIDFWRVLYVNKNEPRLLLFAEMKLPGEAWLEFKTSDNLLVLTATFRPKGIMGRLYWMLVYPFHGIIFNGMLKKLTK